MNDELFKEFQDDVKKSIFEMDHQDEIEWLQKKLLEARAELKSKKPKVVIVGHIGNEGRSHLEALATNHDLIFAQTSIDSIKTESLEKLIIPIKIEPLSDIGKLKTYLPEKGSKYHK